jgi:uncharacterized membrane-anchored protein YhcB (DUF1043 family)
MSGILKGIIFAGVVGGIVAYGMDSKVGKEQEELQQSLTDMKARLRIAEKEVDTIQAKRTKLQQDVGNLTDLEKTSTDSMAAIPEEQKKSVELMAKFTALDAERASAILAVREKDKQLPPRQLTLKDGSKLEKFVLRNVGDDEVITAEHADGLAKLTPDKLTPEYAAHLGLGWKPAAPSPPELKAQEKVLVSVAQQSLTQKLTPEQKAEIKNLESKSASEQLAKVKIEMAKVSEELDSARAEVRALDIRKSDGKVKGGNGVTYGQLKVEAGTKVSMLAKKLTSLQAQKRALEKQIKGIATDGY